MVENVRGLLGSRFDDYRKGVIRKLKRLGYVAEWRLLNACDFGVPQLRPRSILIALRPDDFEFWEWPTGDRSQTPTVGQVLLPTMTANGWTGARQWAKRANDIAPTLVGGSRKHGGADLGPTRARAAWAALDVNGLGLADAVPESDHVGPPKLTVVQAAIIQGFPIEWEFQGRKTASYRQVGNAFPPPVAQAIGESIINTWRKAERAATKRTLIQDDNDLRSALAAI
jgi:DNA (cytosine-5)-methyltransferase 1